MNLYKKTKTLLFCAVTLSLFSCTKEEGPLSDIIPTSAVIVSNAVAFRPEPTVTVSKAAVVSPGVLGPITISLSIPQSSPRTIKEITRVAASTSYSQVQGLSVPPAPFPAYYNTTPIPGSGKSVVFTTTLTEFTAKTGQPVAATNAELNRRFYFLLTLDDNSQVISEGVRVLVQD